MDGQRAPRTGVEGLIQRDTILRRSPVMVVQNDHAIGLYNGDMGLCLPDEHGRLAGSGSSKPTAACGPCRPAGCPPRNAYAMTIHKSQVGVYPGGAGSAH